MVPHDRVLLVYGGSSGLFRYTGARARLYDTRVNAVRAFLYRGILGIKVIRGDFELSSITDSDIEDSIGHLVWSTAFDKFLEALYQWCCFVRPPYARL